MPPPPETEMAPEALCKSIAYALVDGLFPVADAAIAGYWLSVEGPPDVRQITADMTVALGLAMLEGAVARCGVSPLAVLAELAENLNEWSEDQADAAEISANN